MEGVVDVGVAVSVVVTVVTVVAVARAACLFFIGLISMLIFVCVFPATAYRIPTQDLDSDVCFCFCFCVAFGVFLLVTLLYLVASSFQYNFKDPFKIGCTG